MANSMALGRRPLGEWKAAGVGFDDGMMAMMMANSMAPAAVTFDGTEGDDGMNLLLSWSTWKKPEIVRKEGNGGDWNRLPTKFLRKGGRGVIRIN